MSAKIDLFDVTFDILQKSLKYDSILNIKKNDIKDKNDTQISNYEKGNNEIMYTGNTSTTVLSTPIVDSNTKAIDSINIDEMILEMKLYNMVILEMKRKSYNYKNNFTTIRNLLFYKYKNIIQHKSKILQYIENKFILNNMLSQQYNNIIQQRLSHQKYNSEKRIKDLFYEVIGEYSKSYLRIERFHDHMLTTSRMKLILSLWKLQWQKFIIRFKYDIQESIINDLYRSRYHNSGRSSSNSNSSGSSYGNVMYQSQLNSIQQYLQKYIECIHITSDYYNNNNSYIPTTTSTSSTSSANHSRNSSCNSNNEIDDIINKVTKKIGLLTDKNFIVQSIIKIGKTVKEKTVSSSAGQATTTTSTNNKSNNNGNSNNSSSGSSSGSNNLSNNLRLASTIKEMQEIFNIVRDWIKRNNPVYNAGFNANPTGFNNSSSTNANASAIRSTYSSHGNRVRSATSSSSSRHDNRSSNGRHHGSSSSSAAAVATSITIESMVLPSIKQFLQCSHIEWMHPSSYLHSQWDSLYRNQYNNNYINNNHIPPELHHYQQKQHSIMQHTKPSSPSSSLNESPTNQFIRRYHAQYSSSLFNERLYFCLEERSLTSAILKKKIHTESISNLIHQLNPSDLGRVDLNNPENQRVLIENEMTIFLIERLQV